MMLPSRAMSESVNIESTRVARAGKNISTFTEFPLWEAFGAGWERLHGSFRDMGFSVEWHDFQTTGEIEWNRSFHPNSVELCFNFDGNGQVQTESSKADFGPQTSGFYVQRDAGLAGTRRKGENHRFLTVELALPFLERHLDLSEPTLYPGLKRIFQGRKTPVVSKPLPLTQQTQQIISSLRTPPVSPGAQRLWGQAKVLELASSLLFEAPVEEELFCQRQKKLNHERVQKVITLLKANLAEPPTLEEIGKRVACSPFHLSRIFSTETGMTIPQFLRQLRLERAAELLRSGSHNVTEAAVEVGYSSLSHFSTAFHQMFGCCPGLYPISRQVTTPGRP